MKKSDSIAELSGALALAQAEMKNPAFDAVNPFFKNKYTSLASVRNAVVPVLSKHGVSIMQDVTTSGDGTSVLVTTILMKGDEWIELGPLSLPTYRIDKGMEMKANAQSMGSAVTYGKRYALLAAVGIVGDEDDDAEHNRIQCGDAPHAFAMPAWGKDIASAINAATDIGALSEAWDAAKATAREHKNGQALREFETLKDRRKAALSKEVAP